MIRVAFVSCVLICESACGQSFTFSSGNNSLMMSTPRRDAVAVKPVTPDPAVQPMRVTEVSSTPAVVAKRREWYLVSESWCSNCPAAKKRFLAKGWPESNVLTIAQCQQRFGFRVPYVPYEFGEPETQAASRPVAVEVQSVNRYYNYNGQTIDLATYGGCSARNCGMCAQIRQAQQQYRAAQRNIGPQASSPSDVVDEAIEIMQLTSSDVVAELGCGDGGVAIRLARESGCRVEGYEIDPLKVAEARQNVAAAGLSDRITIHESDVIGLQLPSSVTAVYAYLYPELLEQIKPQLMTGRIAVCPGHQANGIGMRLVGQCWVRG